MRYLIMIFVICGLGPIAEARMIKPRIRPQLFNITNAIELASLPDLVAQFVQSECETVNTARAYKTGLAQFLEFTSGCVGKRASSLSYSDITRVLLADYRKHRLESGSQNTAKIRLDTVKAFTAWMSRRYRVDDPAERVRSVPKPEQEFKGLTPGEVRGMLASAKLESEPASRFLPAFLLYTGCRIDCEALQTRLGQVDLEGLTIRSVLGKGSKLRHVPIDPAGIPEFTHYLSLHESRGACRDSLLFPSPRDNRQPLSYWSGLRIIKERGHHPHSLRHTYAYRFLDRERADGTDAFRAAIKLRRALGHTDINTTLIYLGLQPGDFERHYGMEMR